MVRPMACKSMQLVIGLMEVCAALATAGCGQGGPKVEFAKVQGAVLVAGRPQPNVQIQLTPDREKGIGLPAFAGGVSDDKGNYALRYSFMNKIGDGAPVGWSRVSLIDMSATNAKASAIPPIYNNPTTSPLLIEVKSGDNSINLEVKK